MNIPSNKRLYVLSNAFIALANVDYKMEITPSVNISAGTQVLQEILMLIQLSCVDLIFSESHLWF